MSVRSIVALIVFFVLGAALAPDASRAQTTRRPVTGPMSGADLAIEGPLTVPRSGTLRWSVQAFDVVGLRDIRPSARAELRAFTSFARDRASAELTLDDDGRGLLEIRVPDDVPAGFHVVLELRTRARIVRRFELDVTVTPSRALELAVYPDVLFPGSPVQVTGRFGSVPDGLGVANEPIELELNDEGGPIGRPVRVTTDANGVFTQTFGVPRNVRMGSVRVHARTLSRERPLASDAHVRVVPREAPALLVGVRPSQAIVDSEARINLEVIVRRPDGRPLPRATVTLTDTREIHRDQRVSTDARGRATLFYVMPRLGGAFADHVIDVRVERAGVGAANGRALVRIARAAFAGVLSVEGGRLVPELEGRVYVRAVGIDGRPAAQGTPVTLTGPRVPAGLTASTDAAGVATFDFRLGARAADGEDACGGDAATSLQATIGTGARAGTVSRCASVDADGLVRVRVAAPRVIAGQGVRVSIARAARVARLPVVLDLIAWGTSVVASRTLAGDANEAELAVPAEVRGLVVVRARVLHGAERTALRGGSTGVFASAEEPLTLSSRFDGETAGLRVDLAGPSAENATVVSVAMPIDEARARYGVYDLRQNITLARPQPTLATTHAPSALAAALADQIPTDVGAPAALVAGVVTPLPSPAEGSETSVLRDPYRARARFVEGRLSLVFRAVEEALDASVPAQLDDVAYVDNGRFVFNASILEVASRLGTLGGEGATGLSGELITVPQLTTLDGAFTYDNVARRVTRKRLFMLLLELRAFVREHQLDLGWARPGEPHQWLAQLLESSGSYAQIEPRHLVDGWGRPFALVPTSRPRFDRVVPVPGFELVSAGPDGRVGSRDDIWDPAARMLPAGVYAQAVGEDALVARLAGVELGRMTIEQGLGMFPVEQPSVPETGDAIAPPDVYGTPSLPGVLETDADALALRRVTQTVPSALVRVEGGAGRTATIPVDAEPRTWGVLTVATTRTGAREVSLSTARAGSAVLVNGLLPERVRVSETLTVDVPLTNVTDTDRDVRITTTSEALRASAPASVRLPAGQTVVVPLELAADAPGAGTLRMSLADANGVALGTVASRFTLDRGEHPERRRVTALAGARAMDVTLRAPDDARDVSARLVLVSPQFLSEMPDIADTRQSSPSIVAWSQVMSGREVAPVLRAQILRRANEGTLSLVERAAAVLSLATLEDPAARTARAGLESGLAPGDVGLAAAFLALASAGVPDDVEGAQDAVGRFLQSALVPLRRTLRDAPEDRIALARASAALLVASAEDAHGLAMLERVEPHLTALGNGALVEAQDADRLDIVSATFALAIASHQVGKNEQRDRLLRGALSEIPTLGRAGGEHAFWYLAVGAYGLLPSETPKATVRIGGETTEVSLEEGRVVLPITLGAGDAVRVRVSTPAGESVVAGVEGAYVVPFTSDEGPLRVQVRGDIGRIGRLAALELEIHANENVARPVVEVSLPAGVVADDALLASIERTGRVADAEARRPGFVRITLAPLGSGADLRIPLPLQHRARGRMSGLGISAYPGSEPYRRTIVPPQVVDVPAEED